MRFRFIVGYCAVIAASLLLVGCTEADPLNRQAVTGTVSLNGAPLAKASIEFSPKGSGNPSGASIEDGKFEMPAERGLAPGTYIVRVNASDGQAAPVEVPGESNVLAKELIPAEFNTDSKTEFTVKAGEENVFTLDIPSPASK